MNGIPGSARRYTRNSRDEPWAQAWLYRFINGRHELEIVQAYPKADGTAYVKLGSRQGISQNVFFTYSAAREYLREKIEENISQLQAQLKQLV